MIKKLAAAVCILALCLLCGCVPATPDDADSKLWASLDGCWVNADGEYILFSTENEAFLFTGEITDLENPPAPLTLKSVKLGSDGSYRLVLAGASGTSTLYLNTNKVQDGTLKLRSADEQSYTEYSFVPQETDIDRTDEYVAVVWPLLEETWVNSSDEYVLFAFSGNIACFAHGALSAMQTDTLATVSALKLNDDGIYELTVYYAAQSATELSPATAEYFLTVSLDLSLLKTKVLLANIDGGSWREYTVYDEQTDETETLALQLWSKLSGLYSSYDMHYMNFTADADGYCIITGEWQSDEPRQVWKLIRMQLDSENVYRLTLEQAVEAGEAAQSMELVIELSGGTAPVYYADSAYYLHVEFYTDPEGSGLA